MTGLSNVPARRLAVLTCMDCRIDPLAVGELELGDAHVIRNAGGLVTDDAVRSLALSQRTLGTETVWVIMHTGCGVLGLDDEQFLDEVERETDRRPDWQPGGFADLERELARGVERLRADPAITAGEIRGFVLDIESGELSELNGTGR